ncbi:MAG: sigma-54-dependent Fis family transcriptional regulator [Paludibacteraceae bacterium]|nr:sigma-54-dependent Fis family transcriptional regulator [Paludibacteraceae bacterium]
MTPQEIQSIKQRFGIIGVSPLLNHDIEIAVQVAKTDLSVLITGESGVGKEHFPQIIHNFSARKHGPYFAVNCGAIPEGTIDSELFGHEKGAFTDARAERKGYFEIADGGTLFLDEVGELPLATQARLLRVLETGEYIRMGSSKVLKTNVRVVAATNIDMQRAISRGRFREDLYYRLNSVEIRVPALRERREDIPLLFRKFAVDFSERYRIPPIRLTDEATQLLRNYYWNGNVRQLKHVAEQISILEPLREIQADVLQKYLPRNEAQNALTLTSDHGNSSAYEAEREMLLKMLFELKREVDELKQQIASAPLRLGGALAGEPPASQVAPSAVLHTAPAPDVHNEPQHNLEPEEEFQLAEVVTDAPAQPAQPEQPETLSQVERDAIRQALLRNHGNRKATAQELQLSERTLYRKIKEYGL